MPLDRTSDPTVGVGAHSDVSANCEDDRDYFFFFFFIFCSDGHPDAFLLGYQRLLTYSEASAKSLLAISASALP